MTAQIMQIGNRPCRIYGEAHAEYLLLQIRYTYQDEQGKNCNKWESFSTKEEATNRKKQIEHELANGTFLIPSTEKVHRSSFPPE